jgi:hypothetical protein
MKIIKADNFIQIKAELSNSVPFFAYIVTSWHLDNLIAYLLLSKLKGGVVIIRPQSNIKNDTRFRLTEDNFIDYEYLFDKVYFLNSVYIKIDIFALIIHFLSFPRKDSYLIVPDTRLSIRALSSLLYLHLSFNYILIDEGLGSYLPYENFLFYGKSSYLKQKIKNILYLLFIKPIIKKSCNIICDFRFYNLEQDKLICNNAISMMLNKIYTNRGNNTSRIKQYEKNILIFKDFGVVDQNIDFDIYSHVLDYLQNTAYHIYIKRHPNDMDKLFENFLIKYSNVTLLYTKKSGEELVAIYSPNIIIGGYTTVLFSSVNIFNVHAISFMKIYLTFSNLNRTVRQNINFFISKFDNNTILMFPSGFDEFFCLVDKILK